MWVMMCCGAQYIQRHNQRKTQTNGIHNQPLDVVVKQGLGKCFQPVIHLHKVPTSGVVTQRMSQKAIGCNQQGIGPDIGGM